jgi:hypothetical protein
MGLLLTLIRKKHETSLEWEFLKLRKNSDDMTFSCQRGGIRGLYHSNLVVLLRYKGLGNG